MDFFPLLDALALETEDDQTSAQLEELREMVNSVLKRFKKEVDHTMSVHVCVCNDLPPHTLCVCVMTRPLIHCVCV